MFFSSERSAFVGHVIGSGRHRPDEEKLATISDLAKPTSKRMYRKMIGFFSIIFIHMCLSWQSYVFRLLIC
jgi:hypothetical protein